jgi:hypothetical protein
MPASAAVPRPVETSRHKRALRGIAIGVAVTALLAWARGTRIGEALDLRLTDLRTRRLAGARAPDPRIVLCQIVEDDLQRLQMAGQPWPWDLELVNAPIFDLMKKAGVAAVMVDVPSSIGGPGGDDPYRELPPDVLEKRTIEAGKAEELAGAWTRIGAVAAGFELAATPGWEIPGRIAVAEQRLRTPGLTAPAGAFARAGANLPVRRLAEAATVLGFTNGVEDGRHRRGPDGRGGGRGRRPALATAS